jgi:hypothetical protein
MYICQLIFFFCNLQLPGQNEFTRKSLNLHGSKSGRWMVQSWENCPKTLEYELDKKSWTLDLVHQSTMSIVILRRTYKVLHLLGNLNEL